MASTVLFYGAATHPGLRRLYEHVQARQRRQARYLAWESLPPLALASGEDSTLLVDGESLALKDVCSACLDGIYAPPPPGPLNEADRNFAQTEIWATLIALFGVLSQRVPVANVVRPRDVIESRLALMSHLSRHGLATPRMLATSHPQAARDFCGMLDGRVLCRTLAYTETAPRWVAEEDLERLDSVRLAPVLFEEVPDGEARTVVVVDHAVFGPHLPKKLKSVVGDVCRGLGLTMAAVTVVESDGRWLATDVETHLTEEVLQDGKILEAATEWLECR